MRWFGLDSIVFQLPKMWNVSYGKYSFSFGILFNHYGLLLTSYKKVEGRPDEIFDSHYLLSI